ncbi:hypothetical protein N7471_006288 [Penicillium samsonianum]|uniref:uncharacterized protein n=1 Tax=Penicillium samsonianum TaxID=1882272 RepID=UPI002547DB94|nr:uncharacterized protein N7471_006288 [Penicillium samsonianum]KAJ6139802.1 hypothetical protein N7471_006288 [Penicillium samsonianum]
MEGACNHESQQRLSTYLQWHRRLGQPEAEMAIPYLTHLGLDQIVLTDSDSHPTPRASPMTVQTTVQALHNTMHQSRSRGNPMIEPLIIGAVV